MPVPCVIDEYLMDPSISALYKEGQDRNFDTYMQNFTYITERLLDPSLGLDTKSSQLGCTCTQPQCFPESCDHVYLFDNDNDDAEYIYGQPMHDNSCRWLVANQGIMAAGAINAVHGFRSSVEEILLIYIHSDSPTCL